MQARDAGSRHILANTFTNKAADEMLESITLLIDEAASGMWNSTLRSTCVRILGKEQDRFGYSSSFPIYDSADQRALVKRILKELGDDDLALTPNAVIGKMSRLKNELADVDFYRRSSNSEDAVDASFIEVWDRHQRQLQQSKAFYFNDLIGQTVYLFLAFPVVAAQYQARFHQVLVDEDQNKSHAQYALIQELTRLISAERVAEKPAATRADDGSVPGASLTVVGTPISPFMPSEVRTFATSPNLSVILSGRRSCGWSRTSALPRTSSSGERRHRQQLRLESQEPSHRFLGG